MTRHTLFGILAAGLLAWACTPTVQVAPSKEPIVINMNVKIEHEIRVKLEKELDSVLSPESGLF
ncbi:MAG: YnbE family lipoprotein [Desulfobulbus sp.]